MEWLWGGMWHLAMFILPQSSQKKDDKMTENTDTGQDRAGLLKHQDKVGLI